MNHLLQCVLIFLFLGVIFSCVVTDHRSNRLPDYLTLPLLLFGILFNITSNMIPLHESGLGATVGYLSIRCLHDLQISFRGIAGIGLGDAKLFAALGAWFGWQSLPTLLVGASIVMLTVYPKRQQKPFGVGLGFTACGFFALHLLLT